jgi:SCP-2 sterol transfer family
MAVLEFLSDEWLAALGKAVAGALPPDLSTALALGQVVTDVESNAGGEVRYTLLLGPGSRALVVTGSTEGAEVVLTISYATASALARGVSSAASLFEQGSVKISGDARRLVEVTELLDILGGSLSELRDRTAFR